MGAAAPPIVGNILLRLSLQGRIRWALAGRDRLKLENIREELSRINPDCEKVPIILANANEAETVSAMAKQAQASTC